MSQILGETFSGTYFLGYWNDSRNSMPEFPSPIQNTANADDRNTAIKVLAAVECAANSHLFKNSDVTVHEVHYRGWSNCRICGCMNGSSEYEICVHSSLYGKFIIRIPVGYLHYVKDHNVQPDMKLISLIEKILVK